MSKEKVTALEFGEIKELNEENQTLKEKIDYKLKIIKAIEVSENTDLSKYDDSLADYLLLDSGKGSGKTFDWHLIRKDLKKEFFLAGGLNSKNITQAIGEFKPYAIDLSSGVESDCVRRTKCCHGSADICQPRPLQQLHHGTGGQRRCSHVGQ